MSGMAIALTLLESSVWDRKLSFNKGSKEVRKMRYGIAWLLGVPVSVLVVWFLVTHLL